MPDALAPVVGRLQRAYVKLLLLALLLGSVAFGQTFKPARERPPMPPREFRGAWVAVVHNIDWPSKKGLSAGAQQAELRALLDRMASLNMNAMIFQVRPHCDAVYASSREPWSPWLTGTMGKSPGYDPLKFCIDEAHRRGIEVHAWFNPFRALSNEKHGTSSTHVCRSSPHITKRYAGQIWCDPAAAETRQRAMAAILDVVRRYDVDGVHLDDYFYPYPKGGLNFPDGRTPSQRRAVVDGFVEGLYRDVKAAKPWVRVGISPFGIWRPGVPDGIEAGLDAYEQLGADARKWLAKGWVDYLAPQLYWRDQPRKQSFSALLEWWRKQGSRPVWPGIATSRINSTDDPGRPASEILKQVGLSRTVSKNWVGHIHWSISGLKENRGGISTALAKSAYSEPALVPPMPWMGKQEVARPSVEVKGEGQNLRVRWRKGDAQTSVLAVMGRFGSKWHMLRVLPAGGSEVLIKAGSKGMPDAVSISAADRFGNLSGPVVLAR